MQTQTAPFGARTQQAMTELSDTTLMVRVVDREEAALGTLYSRYRQRVYHLAHKITRDRMVAEEVTQDVFHAVWQSAARFHTHSPFAAWLCGIAAHRAIDATRSRRFRAQANETTIDDSLAATCIGTSDSVLHAIVIRAAIHSALIELSAAQRQVLALAYADGLTHTEIAALLGEPVGTVKSRIYQALFKLRTHLYNDEG